MILGLKPDWKYIGARLAQSDDGKQTEFFRHFVKECQTWGTKWQIQQQLASVNHKLTEEERSILRMIGYEEGDDE